MISVKFIILTFPSINKNILPEDSYVPPLLSTEPPSTVETCVLIFCEKGFIFHKGYINHQTCQERKSVLNCQNHLVRVCL